MRPGRKKDPLERIACALERFAGAVERIEAKLEFAADSADQVKALDKLSGKLARGARRLKKAGDEAGT